SSEQDCLKNLTRIHPADTYSFPGRHASSGVLRCTELQRRVLQLHLLVLHSSQLAKWCCCDVSERPWQVEYWELWGEVSHGTSQRVCRLSVRDCLGFLNLEQKRCSVPGGELRSHKLSSTTKKICDEKNTGSPFFSCLCFVFVSQQSSSLYSDPLSGLYFPLPMCVLLAEPLSCMSCLFLFPLSASWRLDSGSHHSVSLLRAKRKKKSPITERIPRGEGDAPLQAVDDDLCSIELWLKLVSAADYFSRSNRRGSVVSDVDDVSIPDLTSLDEKSDKQYAENYTRPSSRNSASATTPLSGNSSRRGSGDTSSLIDPDTSLSELRDIYDLKDQIQDVEGRYMQGLKELKESLSEVEEKYKKAMVSNAQLDNEKNNLIYQVDTLKDVIEEQEEQMAEFYRENEEKSKELERQKHMCSVLQHKMDELKEGLRQRDELIEEKQHMQQKIDTMTKEVFELQETLLWKDKSIRALEKLKEHAGCLRSERDALREELATLKAAAEAGEKHGLVIIPDGTPNGDVHQEPAVGAITVVSQEAAQVLESAGEGPLDVRLRKLAGEKEELLSQIRKLKLQLEEERQKGSRSDGGTAGDLAELQNGSDLQLIEMQRDANRQISEYKFKLSKAEQDITTLEQSINRLEGQVLRYKTAAENAEKVEDELKAEKRKLQRELRTALDKIEEMEMTNSHLAKRLEKMKANRTALLAQQ
ncbi:hypothetical protein FD754_005133, partial [Muntiacus muntjak]